MTALRLLQGHPQEALARRAFLGVLFEHADGLMECRALPSRARAFFQPSDLARLEDWIGQHVEIDNLYIGIAARKDARSGTLENCATLGALFVDVDFKMTPEAEAREALAAFPLPPTMVVHSGGGLHVYYGLREPLDLRAPATVDRARRALVGLAQVLGGDRSAAEPARVLRVPGTLNRKPEYGAPRPVVLEDVSAPRYNLHEIEEWLPAPEADPSTNGRFHTLEAPIGPGGRRPYIFRLARSLKTRGLSEAAVLAAALAENRERCQPPLADDLVAEQVRFAFERDDRPGYAPQRLAGEPDDPAETPYLEPIDQFLAEADPPMPYIFPELLPEGLILLFHGDPRSRKSLAAFELALSGATGTAPFGLARFQPTGPVPVVYVQEEDARVLTKMRVRRLVRERCGAVLPAATLTVSVRRGINLDDPAWVARLIQDLLARKAKLLVLDAARRLSAKTDEGPQKVRELMAVLRAIIRETGVSIVIVHHDVKPSRDGQDQRRRSHRASGGDWFAASECPVHVERISESESLLFPEDYKFSADPAPFTFATLLDGKLIRRLVGRDTDTESAEKAGKRGKLFDWIKANGPATKSAMKKAGLGWESLDALLEALCKEGKVDAEPGRTANSYRYFVSQGTVSDSQDSSHV